MLGRKQTLTNDDWLNMLHSIAKSASASRIEALAYQSAKAIQKAADGRAAAYGWSGGKDSLVLNRLCEMAGVTECFMCITELEYPVFVKWINEHKPPRLSFVRTGQDIVWLSKHPNYLFPQTSKGVGKWFPIVQWNGQRQYYEQHGLDLLILGRRRLEGNFVGNNGGREYTSQNGMNILNPIADWRHEDVYGFIYLNKIELPPIYFFKNGFRRGTHPWPIRKWTGSVENGWREVYDIDPDIVTSAAPHIESAKLFLEGLR